MPAPSESRKTLNPENEGFGEGAGPTGSPDRRLLRTLQPAALRRDNHLEGENQCLSGLDGCLYFCGNNASGKTNIQRALVELLAGAQYQRLPSNNVYSITHDYLMRKFRKMFVAGRSYQELKAPTDYTTVEEYFRKLDSAGAEVDIAFMASHLDPADIEVMVEQAHRRFWNVCGIFLTNSIAWQTPVNADISARLWWDERWLAENAPTEDGQIQTDQFRRVATTILQMLIERTRGW